jgi:uncharacterized damage-inducible protein DinB
MIRRDQFLRFYDEIVTSSAVFFRHVPAEKVDWRPFESFFTLGQLMAHMAISTRVYADGVTDGQWGFTALRAVLVTNRRTPPMDPPTALERLRENATYFTERLSSLSERDFEEGEVFSPQFNGPAPRWRVAMLAAEHQINHKAELFMSLKMLKITLHTGHLYHLERP